MSYSLLLSFNDNDCTLYDADCVDWDEDECTDDNVNDTVVKWAQGKVIYADNVVPEGYAADCTWEDDMVDDEFVEGVFTNDDVLDATGEPIGETQFIICSPSYYEEHLANLTWFSSLKRYDKAVPVTTPYDW